MQLTILEPFFGPTKLILNSHPNRQQSPALRCTGNSISLSSTSQKIHKRGDKEEGGEENDSVGVGDVIRTREFGLLGRFIVEHYAVDLAEHNRMLERL